jgi:hypothetical protein
MVNPFRLMVMSLAPAMSPSVLHSRFAESVTLSVTTWPQDKLELTGAASAELEPDLDSVGVISLLLSLLLLVGRALSKTFSTMLPFSDAKIGCVNKAPTDANAKIAAMRYILLFIRTN